MLIRWVGLDAEDAEQIAMLGVIEAAKRFDPAKGYQFPTVNVLEVDLGNLSPVGNSTSYPAKLRAWVALAVKRAAR